MEARNDDRIAVPWPTVIMGDEHQSLTLSQLPILTADKMKYVNLGKSGLKVSQIILGCMSYGVKRPADKWTWVLEEEEAMKHLKVSFDIHRVHSMRADDVACLRCWNKCKLLSICLLY
jgi:hypothetical protein